MLKSSEFNTLTQALEALQQETGLDFSSIKQLPANSEADFLIETPEHTIIIEVKRNIRPAHLGSIIQRVKKLEPIGLLVADYINPNIAKTLKDNNVQYIDTWGNSYLNLPPIYVNISGQKPLAEPKQEPNRAFDIPGLKLIHAFLCDKSLVNASYRDIAERTGIALGAVGNILSGLADAGYLINPDKAAKRQLINYRKLIDRWAEAYPEKLRPKLHVGDFITDDTTWWTHLDIARYGAYWSGEVGAGMYVSYLRPQIGTIYLSETSGNTLLADTKLRKANEGDDEGLIHIYRPFWPETFNHKATFQNVVNPFLVYADLISSADSRNLEAARMLYDTTITEYIGED